MEIYKGPCLIVKYEKESNRFVNLWVTSPKSFDELKSEMLEYKSVLEKINPSQVIFLQKNFKFQMTTEIEVWVAENITNPRLDAGFISESQDGFHHIAFVVGQDVLTHMGVMGIFKERSRSVFRPKHFATELEARNWLDNEYKKTDIKNQNIDITYKGLDNQGRAIIEFKDDSSKISSNIKSLEGILEENNFIKNNIEKYLSLTLREKETLKLILKGYSNKEIADKMHISSHTTRTHRNRIWKKLEITHYNDCLKYGCFFN